MHDWASVQFHQAKLVQHWVIAHKTHSPAAELHGHERLSTHLEELGCTMVPTDACGDCGIDALSFYDHDLQTSTIALWRQLRVELKAHMLKLAADARWRAVFQFLEIFDVHPQPEPTYKT